MWQKAISDNKMIMKTAIPVIITNQYQYYNIDKLIFDADFDGFCRLFLKNNAEENKRGWS